MLLKIIGIIFVVLATLGVFLPLLPTTPFLLVASVCFAKSSPKLYKQLNNNKVFGPLIRNWEETRSIPKKGKAIALVSMFVTMSYSMIILKPWYLKLLLIVLMIGPVIFIYRLPTTESLVIEQKQQDE